MSTPFLLLGDGPQEPTGLGRIARDLRQVLDDIPDLEVVQVGGPVFPAFRQWECYPLGEDLRGEDWGASYVQGLYQWRFGRRPGIIFAIWDPSRLYSYLQLDLPVQKWAYLPIDADNIRGSIGGPARDVVANFDRVLAYGRWGSQIIRTVRDRVPYLPHGLMTGIYADPPVDEEQAEVEEILGPFVGSRTLIGCVATNQPRKDLGLLFHAVATLRGRGMRVHLWLHTDVLVKAWAIQQLVEDFGLAKQVTVTTQDLTDRQLACLYHACTVTIAPGLGEGFGYPIVESLAAGTPVVHGDFGGGRELVPKKEWRFPVRRIRLESVYAVKRPVFDAEDVANAVERAIDWREETGEEGKAYLRGTVAHLDWSALRGRWVSWLRQGMEG